MAEPNACRNARLRRFFGTAPSELIRRTSQSPEFQAYQVKMRDGSVLMGTQFHFRGDAFSTVLPDGCEVRHKLSEAESWEVMSGSSMPPGLAMTMTIEEFRDLVAFLSARR